MPERKSGVLVVAALVPALVLGLVLSLILLGGDDSDDLCLPGSQQPGITIDPDSVPDTPIAGYNHEQLVNAAWIMQAANALGLSARDQTIGVMTAMGESSLRNIDYGDWETGGVTNPDGTRTEVQGADLFRIRDGQIVEKQAMRKQRPAIPAK